VQLIQVSPKNNIMVVYIHMRLTLSEILKCLQTNLCLDDQKQEAMK